MQGIWYLPSLIFSLIQGFSTGSWQMLIFSLLSLGIWPLGRWLKRHRGFDLDGQVRFDGSDVWIGEHRLPRGEIFWRREWHEFVYAGLAKAGETQQLPQLLAKASGRGFRGTSEGAVWLGAEAGVGVDFDLSVGGPHLLIIGATGTGKSELLRLLVTGWLHQKVQLSLIDYKGGATMGRFAKHPSVVALATDIEATAIEVVAATLERQLRDRQLALAEAKCSSIEEFQSNGGSLARHIVVIDELGELLRQQPRLAQVLEQLAARGRSLGLHIVAANQSMSGISRALLVNLRARIVLGDLDPIDLNMLGFKSRAKVSIELENWRGASLKMASGTEHRFVFPIGF